MSFFVGRPPQPHEERYVNGTSLDMAFTYDKLSRNLFFRKGRHQCGYTNVHPETIRNRLQDWSFKDMSMRASQHFFGMEMEKRGEY